MSHSLPRRPLRAIALSAGSGGLLLALLASTGPAQAASAQAASAPATPATAPAAAAGAAAAAATHRVYYVAPTGNDASAGSATKPWRTLQRASAARLAPGDRLLLRAGARYVGRLTISSSGTAAAPVVVGRYGTGYNPGITRGDCVQLNGSYIRLSSLSAVGCSWGGFTVKGDHVTIDRSTATKNVAGVQVLPEADGTVVSASRIVDNQRMSPGKTGANDDSGAFGVLVQGSNTRVLRNLISGHHAPSPDYGTDGSAVEVYGGRGTVVAGNNAINNLSFIELGDASTANTRIERNTVVSNVPDGVALVTRGSKDSFGPVAGTVVEHNTMVMNGANSRGYVCYAGCSPSILTVRDNIFVAKARPAYADSPAGGSNNILVSDQVPSSARVLFVNRTSDLRLLSASPAVDTAGACTSGPMTPRTSSALGASSGLCRDGNRDGKAGEDIGALER